MPTTSMWTWVTAASHVGSRKLPEMSMQSLYENICSTSAVGTWTVHISVCIPLPSSPLPSCICTSAHKLCTYFGHSPVTFMTRLMKITVQASYLVQSSTSWLVAWHSGQSIGLPPANFPCPALDLQVMGDHQCG